MIKEIPVSFRDKNEDYFVLGSLQTFCKEHNLQTTLDKIELISNILDFANKNSENERKVLEWIDCSLKEGVKKLVITKLVNLNQLMNKKSDFWEEIIKSAFNISSSTYIINASHKKEINLCGYNFEIDTNKTVKKVSLNYTILIKEEKNIDNIRTIIYPIFIDIDLKNKYIIGRAKSKSSLYKIDSSENSSENNSTTCEKLINEAISKTILLLDIEEEGKELRNHRFRSIIHMIVDECTKTPNEIGYKLDMECNEINNFVMGFFNRNNIDLIVDNNFNNAVDDIKIFMEKYLSINYHDKDIFTKDRYAFPVQISATDSDFSSVDESTSDDKPLQCTPIFFDNKKLIQREKKCDNVVFVFQKSVKPYFTDKKFPVILEVRKNRMYIDFRKYTLEEDIKNVLSRVIRDN